VATNVTCIVDWKKPTELEIQEERDDQMPAQYSDPTKHYPNKIDQLLDSFGQVRLVLFIEKILIFACLALNESKNS
jgi:hypothetical protein